MTPSNVNISIVGDIIVGNDAEYYFEHVKEELATKDVLIGQLEVPYSTEHPESEELERDPVHLHSLVSTGFDVLSLAGNHLADFGDRGIDDTISWLKNHNISYVGAGPNLQEARKPVVLERNETKIGILKYNCVGPKETWAAPNKPGCAYVNILTHYELQHANPGGPPSIYTRAEPTSLQLMKEDIKQLRSQCDILIVSFHKGLVHQPVKVADYEKEVSYAAIDAGADLIVGEHAHLLKGLEIYKGKTIFHGLCNLVAYVPSLLPKPGQDQEAWSNKRMELFGFVPDLEYPTYPFHPEAIYTMIAKVKVKNREIVQTSFVPCIVNKKGQPVVVKQEDEGQKVFDYMATITQKANLNARYRWEGNEIVVE
ncbi:CapA family protein [Halalkalibacter krulwichiae]|uniref:Capsule biosynthesis protein CapA n=1 Tax=Halalkalibacter krulwichiae TaxID=199441 RepID=A0A1X9M951_9BACI|nr:CapA family protein [Halalkalibacter krulwichiae]ARK29917.1 Capsule biosynthesis protein CapA [Halalkalibacter krulwichiae]